MTSGASSIRGAETAMKSIKSGSAPESATVRSMLVVRSVAKRS